MSSPNVVCQIYFLDNEQALAKNPLREEKYGAKRRFYSCKNSKYNYVDYVQDGSKKPLDYVDYSGNSEKSTGVFNADGLLTKEQRKSIKKALSETKSVIWHGFMSFTEEFGNLYCNDYESAYRMMKTEFPRFLKSAGLDPKNVIWYAGLHENTDNRHIHFSFFEKEPMKYRARSNNRHFSNGKLPYYSIEQFKLRAEQKLTDSTAQLKLARKQLTESTKNVLFSAQSPLRYNREIQTLMLRLLETLPATGRLSYDSKNIEPFRPQIQEIINCVIRSDRNTYESYVNFCRVISDKDKDTMRILSNLKIKPEQWDRFLISDKYMDDLYRRLGNQVLNSLRVYKGKLKPAKSRLTNKRIRRGVRTGLIAYCAKLNAIIEHEAQEAFEEYYEKIRERDTENEIIKEEMLYEIE